MTEAALAPIHPASRANPPAATRFAPGSSGNPTGRPKGEKGLATYIRRRTRSGREMADVMLAIMRGLEPAPIHERMAAASWLTTRAFGPPSLDLPAGTTLQLFTLVIGDGRADDD